MFGPQGDGRSRAGVWTSERWTDLRSCWVYGVGEGWEFGLGWWSVRRGNGSSYLLKKILASFALFLRKSPPAEQKKIPNHIPTPSLDVLTKDRTSWLLRGKICLFVEFSSAQ